MEHNDPVGEVCGHDEIMLNHECCFLRMQDEPAFEVAECESSIESQNPTSIPFDDFTSDDTLLRVEETR